MCGRSAGIQCPGCQDVWYCSHTHGSIHYRSEVGRCFPWRVSEEEDKGRIMVTTRRVRAGETLFMEEPIVHGPSQTGAPVCLTCYAPVTLDYCCARCGYPMCDDTCATSTCHVSECEILSRAGRPVFDDQGETEAYHCILPLRLLLLSTQDKERFSFADHLMDHEEERRGSDDWKTTERTIVDHLVNKCRAGDIEGFTVDQVRRAVGVLEVNCYEVYSFIEKLGSTSAGLRGCYPAASLLSHSCVANSRHVWGTSPPYTNTCIATVDLEPGTEVVTSYVHPTTCSLTRRPKLLAGWYFECGCERCCSRSELDTHHNTLRCPACAQLTMLPTNHLSLGSDWSCESCGHEMEEKHVVSLVRDLHEKIREITDNNKYDVSAWLQLLDHALMKVHHQHEVVIEIAKFLVPIMCRGPGMKTSDFPLKLVKSKLDLAQWHLNVTETVDPGFSKSRVKVLYEVLETRIFLAFNQDKFDIKSLNDVVEDCLVNLPTIIKVLESLKTENGFETMIIGASHSLLNKCKILKKELKSNNFKREKWCEESWYLIDLCKPYFNIRK